MSADTIAQSGYQATASLAQEYDEILALEETITLTYSRLNIADI